MSRLVSQSGTLMPGFDCDALALPGVRAIEPYQPGKPLAELERAYGISGAIKLASNENPLGPSPKARAAAQAALADIERYPDGGGFALKRALADRLGIGPDQITLGNGSNDVLELVARAFAGSHCEIVYAAHAFAVYGLVTRAVGARAVVVRAKAWAHDLVAMRAAITSRTRLVYLANPNNPTGSWFTRGELETFLRGLPPHVLVVLDEAYFEYVEEAEYPNGVAWVERYPQLVVTRTFSKAYGLAGLRVGYAVSDASVANYLNRVRQPFNLNSLALAAAAAALADDEHVARSVALNRAGLEQLRAGAAALGLACLPSVGNFLCVELGRAAASVYDALLRRGVIVRPIANYGMPNHLRITVGLPAENDRCLQALAEALSSVPVRA